MQLILTLLINIANRFKYIFLEDTVFLIWKTCFKITTLCKTFGVLEKGALYSFQHFFHEISKISTKLYPCVPHVLSYVTTNFRGKILKTVKDIYFFFEWTPVFIHPLIEGFPRILEPIPDILV